MSFCDSQKEDVLIRNSSDVIIDLNVEFSLGLSKFIAYLKSNIKIGFKSKFSDYFYNLQLDVKGSDVMEDRYKKVQQILNSL